MERRRVLSLLVAAAGMVASSLVLITPRVASARPSQPTEIAPCYGVKVVQPPPAPGPKRPSKPPAK
jgi:hypothetical protein